MLVDKVPSEYLQDNLNVALLAILTETNMQLGLDAWLQDKQYKPQGGSKARGKNQGHRERN